MAARHEDGPGRGTARAIEITNKFPLNGRVDREDLMAWDEIKGAWKELRGNVREQWGKLTDDDVEQIRGERDQLVGRVQQRYGRARNDAEREVAEWEQRMSDRFANRGMDRR